MMGFRMPDELKVEIDAWAAAQDDKPSRSEAMRRLMKLGLAAESGAAQPLRPTKKDRP
jgi:Arc/MetJ-type ribon-helix-helix transcriptional regulator